MDRLCTGAGVPVSVDGQATANGEVGDLMEHNGVLSAIRARDFSGILARMDGYR